MPSAFDTSPAPPPSCAAASSACSVSSGPLVKIPSERNVPRGTHGMTIGGVPGAVGGWVCERAVPEHPRAVVAVVPALLQHGQAASPIDCPMPMVSAPSIGPSPPTSVPAASLCLTSASAA